MAEAGLVLAVFGAFNNAIQCFDYVHLAKNFDRDIQTTQLKLDVAKLRLSRWGRAVGLDHVDETRPSLLPGILPSTDEYKDAKRLLEHIYSLFEDAEKQSRKLTASNRATADSDPPVDLDPPTASLHNKLSKLSLRNFKPRGALVRTQWAIHSEKHMRRLIEDIADGVKSLVELFPATQSAQRQLVEAEGRELAFDENVPLLEPCLAEQDPTLDAAIKACRAPTSQVFNNNFAHSTNNGGQQLGQQFGTQTNNFGYRPERNQTGVL